MSQSRARVHEHLLLASRAIDQIIHSVLVIVSFNVEGSDRHFPLITVFVNVDPSDLSIDLFISQFLASFQVSSEEFMRVAS